MRGLIGHTESLGTTFYEVAEALGGQPELDPNGWGSAYGDDPWPRPLPAHLPRSTRARLRQHYLAQRPDRVRTLTFVTRQSGSLVSLEDHEGALVLVLSYGPLQDAGGAEAAELSRPNDDLPADMPADARAAVRRLAFTSAQTLEEQLFAAAPGRAAASDRVTTLLGLAAVWRSDLRLVETLRRIARLKADDWALRAAGIALAQREGYQLLLHELWAGETDPELHAELTALLTGQPKTYPAETGA